MRLSHLKIHNFRSVRDLDLECQALEALLGPNNHGKSNILSALEFGLSTSAKSTGQDFFIYRDPEPDELWVEMTFSELTEQEANTFKRYILADRTVCIRKTARIRDGSIDVSYNGWAEQPDEEWLRPGNAGDYATRERVNETPLRELVPPTGRITRAHIEEAQQRYIEEHRDALTFSGR